eukprot:GHVP01001120.1.p1 GENE.GHVP01001120.1~~GHVP01001120.1.p1  ORF type:complete len:2003 (-),score=352.20 GHVP01001120.1:75-5978(-)
MKQNILIRDSTIGGWNVESSQPNNLNQTDPNSNLRDLEGDLVALQPLTIRFVNSNDQLLRQQKQFYEESKRHTTISVSSGKSRDKSEEVGEGFNTLLIMKPLLYINFVFLESLDSYKSYYKRQLKAFVDLHTASGSEWLVAYVVPAPESVEMERAQKRVVERLKGDLTDPKSPRKRVSRVPHGKVKEGKEVIFETLWEGFVEVLVEIIKSSIEKRFLQATELFKKTTTLYSNPAGSVNFLTYFAAREQLARLHEQCHLYREAVKVYDSLECTSGLSMKEQFDALSSHFPRLGFTIFEEATEMSLAEKSAVTSGTQIARDYELDDLPAMPTIFNSHRRNYFRAVRMQNGISMFSFREYVFSLQISNLLMENDYLSIGRRSVRFVLQMDAELRQMKAPEDKRMCWVFLFAFNSAEFLLSKVNPDNKKCWESLSGKKESSTSSFAKNANATVLPGIIPKSKFENNSSKMLSQISPFLAILYQMAYDVAYKLFQFIEKNPPPKPSRKLDSTNLVLPGHPEWPIRRTKEIIKVILPANEAENFPESLLSSVWFLGLRDLEHWISSTESLKVVVVWVALRVVYCHWVAGNLRSMMVHLLKTCFFLLTKNENSEVVKPINVFEKIQPKKYSASRLDASFRFLMDRNSMGQEIIKASRTIQHESWTVLWTFMELVVTIATGDEPDINTFYHNFLICNQHAISSARTSNFIKEKILPLIYNHKNLKNWFTAQYVNETQIDFGLFATRHLMHLTTKPLVTKTLADQKAGEFISLPYLSFYKSEATKATPDPSQWKYNDSFKVPILTETCGFPYAAFGMNASTLPQLMMAPNFHCTIGVELKEYCRSRLEVSVSAPKESFFWEKSSNVIFQSILERAMKRQRQCYAMPGISSSSLRDSFVSADEDILSRLWSQIQLQEYNKTKKKTIQVKELQKETGDFADESPESLEDKTEESHSRPFFYFRKKKTKPKLQDSGSLEEKKSIFQSEFFNEDSEVKSHKSFSEEEVNEIMTKKLKIATDMSPSVISPEYSAMTVIISSALCSDLSIDGIVFRCFSVPMSKPTTQKQTIVQQTSFETVASGDSGDGFTWLWTKFSKKLRIPTGGSVVSIPINADARIPTRMGIDQIHFVLGNSVLSQCVPSPPPLDRALDVHNLCHKILTKPTGEKSLSPSAARLKKSKFEESSYFIRNPMYGYHLPPLKDLNRVYNGNYFQSSQALIQNRTVSSFGSSHGLWLSHPILKIEDPCSVIEVTDKVISYSSDTLLLDTVNLIHFCLKLPKNSPSVINRRCLISLVPLIPRQQTDSKVPLISFEIHYEEVRILTVDGKVDNTAKSTVVKVSGDHKKIRLPLFSHSISFAVPLMPRQIIDTRYFEDKAPAAEKSPKDKSSITNQNIDIENVTLKSPISRSKKKETLSFFEDVTEKSLTGLEAQNINVSPRMRKASAHSNPGLKDPILEVSSTRITGTGTNGLLGKFNVRNQKEQSQDLNNGNVGSKYGQHSRLAVHGKGMVMDRVVSTSTLQITIQFHPRNKSSLVLKTPKSSLSTQSPQYAILRSLTITDDISLESVLPPDNKQPKNARIIRRAYGVHSVFSRGTLFSRMQKLETIFQTFLRVVNLNDEFALNLNSIEPVQIPKELSFSLVKWPTGSGDKIMAVEQMMKKGHVFSITSVIHYADDLKTIDLQESVKNFGFFLACQDDCNYKETSNLQRVKESAALSQSLNILDIPKHEIQLNLIIHPERISKDDEQNQGDPIGDSENDDFHSKFSGLKLPCMTEERINDSSWEDFSTHLAHKHLLNIGSAGFMIPVPIFVPRAPLPVDVFLEAPSQATSGIPFSFTLCIHNISAYRLEIRFSLETEPKKQKSYVKDLNTDVLNTTPDSETVLWHVIGRRGGSEVIQPGKSVNCTGKIICLSTGSQLFPPVKLYLHVRKEQRSAWLRLTECESFLRAKEILVLPPSVVKATLKDTICIEKKTLRSEESGLTDL